MHTHSDRAAASFAHRGLDIIGRNFYVVFPLRGKILNPRLKAHGKRQREDFSENGEIKEAFCSLGLDPANIKDVSSLRYGKCVIMTDADVDGLHIRGLFINLIHFYCPSPLAITGLLSFFVGPCVVASRLNQSTSFYSLQEYRLLCDNNCGGCGWEIRPIKGLASLTSADTNKLFSNFSRCLIGLDWDDSEGDLRRNLFGDDSLPCVEFKKRLLQNFDPTRVPDYSRGLVSCTEFVEKELLSYYHHDIVRSIPSVIDGLKLCQRKIMYAALQSGSGIHKVDVLVGQVCGQTSYYHGESVLSLAIIGMAQDFVGTNNVNLLDPLGHFGCRHFGPKESGASRYLSYALNSITNALILPADNPFLSYRVDDGHFIEPETFSPILPLVLLNGARGVATGWSTSIPSYMLQSHGHCQQHTQIY
jgi:DNA topoisomerase-2